MKFKNDNIHQFEVHYSLWGFCLYRY